MLLSPFALSDIRIDLDRFLAYYGESGARCSRSDSAFDEKIHKSRSLVFFLVAPFLFFMPFVYLKELEVVFIDRTIHYHAWRRFIGAIRRDWENAITPVSHCPSLLCLVLMLVDRPPCCSLRTSDSWPSRVSILTAGTRAWRRLLATSLPS